jgi:hypothetical protein
MKIIALVTAVACLGSVAGDEPKIITGARSWKMADGSTQRLRFTGFFPKNPNFASFQRGNAAPGGKPLSAFAPQEQAVFAALRDGSLVLTKTPGLCMNPDFPSGKLDPRMTGDSPWTGETRTWTSTNGKSITARLVCLTDEDVSLLINDTVSRVPLMSLMPDDLAYLERLKGGGARSFVDSVEIHREGWDKGHTYTVSISGERYVALAKQGSRFEEALKAALSHVSSKLDSSKWDLVSFSEELCSPPRETPSFDTQRAAPDKEETPFFYTAFLFLEPSAEAESRRIWPLLTSPKAWPGAPSLQIHLMADGSILEAEQPK